MDLEYFGDEKLVYIYKTTQNIRGYYTYELMFSKNADEIDNVDWGDVPVFENSSQPDDKYVSTILTAKSESDLTVVTFSDFDTDDLLYNYTFYDICDGILAMAWKKNFEDGDPYRLVLHFGEDIKLVRKKLIDHKFDIEE